MTMTKQVEALGKSVVGYVQRCLQPFSDRIKAIEDWRAGLGDLKGDKGDPGKDFDPAILKDVVSALADAMPKPRDGIDGAKGEQGEKGERGEPGEPGPIGERGEAGIPGERGEKGDPGERGETGPMGPIGSAGPAGERGADGAKGEKGDAGEIGPMGPAGPQGERGEPGPAGPVGPIGERGDAGIPGERGEKGDPGIDGQDGAPGPQGERGETGPAGDRGEPGQKGDPGERGEPGINGKSAYDLAVDEGFSGTTKEWLGSLRGADGKSVDPAEAVALLLKDVAFVGLVAKALVADAEFVSKAAALVPKPTDGTNGVDGKDGRDGKDGKSVDIADVDAIITARLGETLDSAVQKAIDSNTDVIVSKAVDAMPKPRDGKDGQDGESIDYGIVKAALQEMVDALPKAKDGRDGTDGRDALDIDVRRGIDSLKRYQPGTFASFRGGLVRAYRQTDAMPEDGSLEDHGWHVIQNGLAELAADLSDDARTLAIAAKMTNGEVITKMVELPTTIYRGIWRDTETYTRGDQTTRDGSTWTLVAPQQKGKPGDEDSGWILSSKRGNHGRDGLKGDKGDRGAQGKDGRDLTNLGPDGRKW